MKTYTEFKEQYMKELREESRLDRLEKSVEMIQGSLERMARMLPITKPDRGNGNGLPTLECTTKDEFDENDFSKDLTEFLAELTRRENSKFVASLKAQPEKNKQVLAKLEEIMKPDDDDDVCEVCGDEPNLGAGRTCIGCAEDEDTTCCSECGAVFPTEDMIETWDGVFCSEECSSRGDRLMRLVKDRIEMMGLDELEDIAAELGITDGGVIVV